MKPSGRPDTDESYAADKGAVTTYAPQYADQVYAITVGSETLYRGNFTGPQLLAKIQDVKSAVPQFKVGTADSWNKYQDGTADAVITGGVDILYVSSHSFRSRSCPFCRKRSGKGLEGPCPVLGFSFSLAN